MDPVHTSNRTSMSQYVRRKRKTIDPCLGCRLHRNLCICTLIPIWELKTRICLVVHRKELKRTTNTGHLAIKCLANSVMRIRGLENKNSLDLSDLLVPEYRTLLFFPSVDAVELNEEFVQKSAKPIQLIVPDGNWRQASKVYSRHPELKNIPKVKISTTNYSKQHLRAEHFPEGMATLQAIAYALGFIEGAAVRESLLSIYQSKLEKTLLGRGQALQTITHSPETQC